VRLYRLTRTWDTARAFDGRRSAECPGRWNIAGKSIVYTASSLSLALLELLVQGAPLEYNLFTYRLEVDDALLERLDVALLPAAWTSLAGRDGCRDLAEAWRARESSLGLIVPSAVVPEAYDAGEFDVIINPRHRDAARVRAGEPARLRLGTERVSAFRVS